MNAVRKGPRRRRERVTVSETEQLWRKFLRQPAQITWDQVENMERNFAEQIGHSGPTRRGALATLAKSGRELETAFGRKADRHSAEAAAELAASIRSMRAFLVAIADCLDTAATRLDLALCGREDMPEVIAAAAKPKTAAPDTIQ
jgi:hypothetical protein